MTARYTWEDVTKWIVGGEGNGNIWVLRHIDLSKFTFPRNLGYIEEMKDGTWRALDRKQPIANLGHMTCDEAKAVAKTILLSLKQTESEESS